MIESSICDSSDDAHKQMENTKSNISDSENDENTERHGVNPSIADAIKSSASDVISMWRSRISWVITNRRSYTS